MVGENPRPDPVALEQDARMASVLAQNRVCARELVEHAQRDVSEVPDRCSADGERHASPYSVERLEPDECRPDQAGLVAELGLDYLQRLVGGLDRLGSRRETGGLEHEVSGSGTKATTDDHDVWVEDIDERSDRDAKQPPDLCERLDRPDITASRLLDEGRGLGTWSVEICGGPIGRETRCNGLEMPAPMAVSLTGLPTSDDDDVPELGPPAVEVIVDHEAATDAGAEGEHDQVGRLRPCPEPPFGERRSVAVVLDTGWQGIAVSGAIGEVNCVEREVRGPQGDAGAAIDVERDAVPDRSRAIEEQRLDNAVDRAQHLGLRSVRGCDLDRAPDRPVARDEAGENLRSTEVDSDNAFFMHGAATISARMPEQEKPYRVYKGGRAKGKVPLRRPSTSRRADSGAATTPRKPRQRRLGLRLTLAVTLMFLLGVVWLVASYLSFSRGISVANDRVPAPVLAELTKQGGLLLSTSTTILVLGTDGGTQPGRSNANRSDSMMLIRTDPRQHRLAFLSIPRDLRVEIPGNGTAKINSAFQIGGPTLALRTVKSLTGLEINHVAFVNFDRFRNLIDSVGGIDVDVPAPILADQFDCPYSAARCRTWDGWRFEKGRQHMNGQRALIYSRIRENRLDASETDLDRARRQQQVVQGTADKVTSAGAALKLPFRGGSIVKPLATDLSAGQVIQLGWAYFRADTKSALHCRLGGEPGSANGQSVIFGSEDNVATVAMFTGRSAPLPPPKGLLYAPGCVIGDRKL